MNKIKELLKKPWLQLMFILIILIGYWTWDVAYSGHVGEYIVYESPEKDKVVQLDTLDVPLEVLEQRLQTFQLPESYDTVQSDSIILEPAPTEEMSQDEPMPVDDREWKYKWWDMILGHISSILGSLVALSIPAYNFWKQKKDK